MAHAARKVSRITAGLALLSAGAAMILLPGPGLLTAAAGVALLARDVPWFERLWSGVRARVPVLPWTAQADLH